MKCFFLSVIACLILSFVSVEDGAATVVNNRPKAGVSQGYRYIYNNDGTDMLSNSWNSFRPLTVKDIREMVDLVADGTGVTTYMTCASGAFAYYRSKYARVIGDDLGGVLPSNGDTAVLIYNRNLKLLEAEGTDYVREALGRARELGLETFITCRMNDLHFNNVSDTVSVFAPDFFRHHPEFRIGMKGLGMNSDGALDFAHQEVRDQAYNMVAEQLDLYGDIIDGFELDFMRFILYFKPDEAVANSVLMTELVRRIKAKVDEVSDATGRRILLTARVPDTWQSCVEKGLDVREWVDEGLIDFLSLSVHWRGDPAVDADLFRKESGVGRRVSIYATVDDGSYNPRETYTHGMMRGAAAYALDHGSDGVYLFNYFLSEYKNGRVAVLPGGRVCRTRVRDLINELGSLKTLRGRSKCYGFYAGPSEYGLHYTTPLPLHASAGNDAHVGFDVADRFAGNRPERALLVFRAKGSTSPVIFIGNKKHIALPPAEEGTAAQYDRLYKVKDNESVFCFEIPVRRLHHGRNLFTLRAEGEGCEVTRMELILDWGDPVEHGYN